MPLEPGNINIGASGWHYDHWRGPFYPPDLDQNAMLAHYAASLPTVEINRTFYSLPERETLQTWRDSTPDGFVFAVKASRYITHMKKLKDCAEPLARLNGLIEALRPKLGPLLFQLPPKWRRNTRRLADFLALLPPDGAHAFEFRDPSWFHPEVYEVLARHGAAFCIYDLAGTQSPRETTADLVYVRLHGPAQQAYQGSYADQDLAGWAGALSAWARQGREVWCFFDNDQAGHAPQNAVRLRQMLKA